MDRNYGKLTVYFENPFWVGVFERIENGKLSVCKVTFGSEPKDYEIWEYVLKYYYQLKFGPAVESIIAMLLQTAITITDGYFTGNYVGENALAAINLGLPILYFYLGVGLCVGVGGTVICGRLLGAEEKQKASEVFSQTLATAVAICILTSIAVFLLFSPILKVLRADGELFGFFNRYYRLMLFTYPLMVVGTILGMFLRVDGKPQICMLVGILSCVQLAWFLRVYRRDGKCNFHVCL